jgi:hypothetical protein
MSFWKWSRTAAANATADGSINWAEGMAPSAVNDSARAMMAAAAKFRDDVSGSLTTSGTAIGFTVSSNQSFDTLAHLDKAIICIVPHATSGTSPTLNVDGLGAKPINKSTGVAIASGTLVQSTPYLVIYFNSTAEFILLGALGVITGALGSNTVVTANITDANVTYAKIQNVTHGKVLGRVSPGDGVVEEAVLPLGQCQLTKSGSNLLLSPFRGNRLTINSALETVPDAGVTLSTGGLSATTLLHLRVYEFGHDDARGLDYRICHAERHGNQGQIGRRHPHAGGDGAHRRLDRLGRQRDAAFRALLVQRSRDRGHQRLHLEPDHEQRILCRAELDKPDRVSGVVRGERRGRGERPAVDRLDCGHRVELDRIRWRDCRRHLVIGRGWRIDRQLPCRLLAGEVRARRGLPLRHPTRKGL